MFSKTKLLNIYEKILAHSQSNNDAELAALAEELDKAIQTMETASTTDIGPGGDNPGAPDIP